MICEVTQAAGIEFNGCYTIQNTVKGTHRTFRVATVRKGSLAGQRIVSLLTGRDNESDYTGFGFVLPDGIKVWRKHCSGIPGQPGAFETYAIMLWSMVTRGESSLWHGKGYRLLIEKRCMRCNRKLTNPESILTGIGPECAGRE
jgi:hypothetical protein